MCSNHHPSGFFWDTDDTDVYQALGFRLGVFLILSSFSARISWNPLLEPKDDSWPDSAGVRRDNETRRVAACVCRLTGSTSLGPGWPGWLWISSMIPSRSSSVIKHMASWEIPELGIWTERNIRNIEVRSGDLPSPSLRSPATMSWKSRGHWFNEEIVKDQYGSMVCGPQMSLPLPLSSQVLWAFTKIGYGLQY